MMTTRGAEALAAALSILQQPQLARLARHSPLPAGMTFLLEVAAGEPTATASALAATGRSETTIRKAAGFFIEQILLSPYADSYRTLGAHRKSPEPELRRHMALLMRWLHPDLVPQSVSGRRFDRSAYAARITKAWECLKTPERRAAYDAGMKSGGATAQDGKAKLRAESRRYHASRRHQNFLNRLFLRLVDRT